MYFLLLPNPQDSPVLEVMFQQALEAPEVQAQEQVQEPPLEVTVFTILEKITITGHIKIGAVDINGFLQGLHTSGVGKDKGINPLSFRRHVLIKSRTATGMYLISLQNLCGVEDSVIHTSLLKSESEIIQIDVLMLRTLLAQKLHLKITQHIVGAYPYDHKLRFAKALGQLSEGL